MRSVQFVPIAQRDLTRIQEYLDKNAPVLGDRFLAKMDETLDLLEKFPEIGRARDELVPGLRCMLVEDYILFYELLDSDVRITRIIHGKRDIKRSMFRRR